MLYQQLMCSKLTTIRRRSSELVVGVVVVILPRMSELLDGWGVTDVLS